jgi:hypothetical protein
MRTRVYVYVMSRCTHLRGVLLLICPVQPQNQLIPTPGLCPFFFRVRGVGLRGERYYGVLL